MLIMRLDSVFATLQKVYPIRDAWMVCYDLMLG
jgi:hypothetical protein